MNKKIQAYQQVSGQAQQDSDKFMINLLKKMKSLLKLGTNQDAERNVQIKSLHNFRLLCNYTIQHLNYEDNKELAILFRDFLIYIEDKSLKETVKPNSENFENDFKSFDHFIEISDTK